MTQPHAWTRADAAAHIRVPTDADDKYSRGVVGLRTGTPAYPGAAVLGVEGAWRAGAGMVRWVGDPDVGRLVLARRPETVLAGGRVGAWVIGSGTDAKHREPDEESRAARRCSPETCPWSWTRERSISRRAPPRR